MDIYGRLIGTIFYKENEIIYDVNKEMVKAGMAWYYKEYSNDKSIENLESVCRENKIGLWIDENPIKPSEFRKNSK